jgi:acetyl esterase
LPLDPAARAVLDLISAPGVPPLNELPVPDARIAYGQMAGLAGEPVPVARTEDACADGVPVKLYWPDGAQPHPVLIWIHGGGWVLGSAAETDPLARDLCARAGCLVVSVDYRLAPEHRFPAAVEDVVTVAKWVAANVESLGGDQARLAVAGDSAGANLAAVLANELPGTFRLQVLIYPATDLTLSHASIQENGDGYLLTKDAVHYFTGQYLGDADPRNPLASPLHADDATLTGSAPALVITAEFDPLRDEGEAYVARLRAAGIPVEHHGYDGMIHAFYAMGGIIPAAGDAVQQVATALRTAYAG